MNTVFDRWAERAESGLGFLTGKYRFYAVDMADAGPAAGAWVVAPGFTSAVLNSTPQRNDYEYTFTTGAPHGLAAGEKVALSGFSGLPPVWAAQTAIKIGDYRRPSVYNGKKWLCRDEGSTDSTEPFWPSKTAEGAIRIDGIGVAWEPLGDEATPALNANWTVYSTPSPTSFTIRTFHNFTYVASGGYVASLGKTYLSEFGPAAARYGPSPVLTGKVRLPGPVFDCNDSSIDLTGADPTEVLLLVQTAALDADPDLADTAQRLVAYYDTMPSLPFPVNAGVVALPVSNGADRLMRL